MRILFLTASLLAGVCPAQNLVINPGFEENRQEIDLGKVDVDCFSGRGVPAWFVPSGGTSDYYAKGVPAVVPGNHAHAGDAFAGFIGYALSPDYREYIGGELMHPLENGKTYTISFYLSLSANSIYSVSQLGVHFSNKKPKHQDSFAPLKKNPQTLFENTGSDSLRKGWMLFTSEYTAEGGELFFIIGNFSNDKETSSTHFKTPRKGGAPYAYYYIDDVSIKISGEETPEDIIAPEPEPTAPDSLPAGPRPVKDTSIAAGKTLVANNIYFETGKSTLLAASYPPLYHILSALAEQPELNVEISGHTDDVGKPAANQELSEARAKAVADFFIANGIDPSRITCKGYGSSQPIGEDKDKNRRVEFRFSD